MKKHPNQLFMLWIRGCRDFVRAIDGTPNRTYVVFESKEEAQEHIDEYFGGSSAWEIVQVHP